VARYDRVIPPGGKGKVTLTIDTSRVRGDFKKKAIVWSNDMERLSTALYLMGHVKPHISVESGGYLSLWGPKGKVLQGHLEITNNHEKPVKITGIDSDLQGRIRWRLQEIKPGFVYRVQVEEIIKTDKDYFGHLFVRTDNPKKPELVIVVNRQIGEGE